MRSAASPVRHVPQREGDEDDRRGGVKDEHRRHEREEDQRAQGEDGDPPGLQHIAPERPLEQCVADQVEGRTAQDDRRRRSRGVIGPQEKIGA
jgi:hypothetical protein